MAREAAGIDAHPYDGIDLLQIAKNGVFKAAVRGMNGWKDNLSSGTGAAGTRRPWVNTGEARADITLEPKEPSLEHTVGGDVVQLFIAEFGRAPQNSMPPRDAIARWVQEKGIASPGDPGFDGVVFAVMRSIAEEGIKGFAPGLKAATESTEGLEVEVARDIEKALERAAG